MKKIEIRCSGANLLDLDDAIALQGELKDLSTENYNKIKKSILKHGFTFPLHIWEKDGVKHIINGHQRCRALKQMRTEGYYIPKLPFDYIEATCIKQAKQLILAEISEFGNMTHQGLYSFIEESEINYSELVDDYRLPEIDTDAFIDEFYSNADFDAGTEDDQGKLDEKQMTRCPNCGDIFDHAKNKA